MDHFISGTDFRMAPVQYPLIESVIGILQEVGAGKLVTDLARRLESVPAPTMPRKVNTKGRAIPSWKEARSLKEPSLLKSILDS